MKFDDLVSTILESNSSELPIPAFDGKREMYGVSFHPPKATLKDSDIRHTVIKRIDSYGIKLLEDPQALSDYGSDLAYRGNNIEHALQRLNNRYQDHYELPIPQKALDELRTKLGHLLGEWLVVDDSANSTTIGLYIIVDIAAMRSNQINKDLQGSDITGFEDLL
jgi:hypothetical protein